VRDRLPLENWALFPRGSLSEASSDRESMSASDLRYVGARAGPARSGIFGNSGSRDRGGRECPRGSGSADYFPPGRLR
jgi:hypothetical protein